MTRATMVVERGLRRRDIVDCSDRSIKNTDGRQRAHIWRNGRNWLYKTHKELGRETGIGERKVGACLQVLEDMGFIVREYHRANGLRTTYIGLNLDQVVDAMAEIHQKRRHLDLKRRLFC